MSLLTIFKNPKSNNAVIKEFVSLKSSISGLNNEIQKLEAKQRTAEINHANADFNSKQYVFPETYNYLNTQLKAAKKTKDTIIDTIKIKHEELQRLERQLEKLYNSRSFKKAAAAEAEAAETEEAASEAAAEAWTASEPAAAREAAEKAGVIRSTEVDPAMITRYGGFSKKKFNTRKLRRGSRKKTKNRKIKKRKTKRNY